MTNKQVDSQVSQTNTQPRFSKGTGKVFAGIATVAASIADIGTALVYKVGHLVPAENWSIGGQLGGPTNLAPLTNEGFTLKEVSYNQTTQQWTMELLQNNKLIKEFTIGANSPVTITPSEYSKYTVNIFEYTRNTGSVYAPQLSVLIKEHMAYMPPTWQSDALIGGVIALAAGVVLIGYGLYQHKKVKRLLRSQPTDDNGK